VSVTEEGLECPLVPLWRSWELRQRLFVRHHINILVLFFFLRLRVEMVDDLGSDGQCFVEV
jgi:hypothetical protein